MPMKRWLARRLPFLLLLVATATLCAAFARLHWFLELFSHFTPYYLVAGLFLAGCFIALRRPRYAAAALAVTATNAALMASAYVTPRLPDPHAGGSRLTIFHFNVGFRHPDVRLVVSHLLANAARYDVVVLIEAGTQWKDEIEKLATAFPHVLRSLDDTPFGLAVLSKDRPAAAALVEAPPGYKRAELELVVAGRPLYLYAVHPPPPIDATLADARRETLDHLAGAVTSTGGSAIVVGDLNLTPYSPHFRRFADAAGLQPARGSRLAASTWPTPFANLGLGIPIDHGFVSRDLAVIAHEIGPDLGSDHLPVTLTVAMPAR